MLIRMDRSISNRVLVESVGFEPTRPRRLFYRQPVSATHPRLQDCWLLYVRTLTPLLRSCVALHGSPSNHDDQRLLFGSVEPIDSISISECSACVSEPVWADLNAEASPFPCLPAHVPLRYKTIWEPSVMTARIELASPAVSRRAAYHISRCRKDSFQMVGSLGVEPSVALRPTDLQSAAVASAAHYPKFCLFALDHLKTTR